MPLTDEMIDEVVVRYGREQDRYRKMVEFVSGVCRDLVSDNAIPATVQARVKDPEHLRAKLKRYRADYSSVDDVFERLNDFAGVRVTTYVESDRERVTSEVCRRFQGPAGGDVASVVKDSNNNFYRATHCQVSLSDEDLIQGYENLRGDSCEIQICSLLAHVWNELEHDLGYKPTTGDVSSGEQGALDALGNLTRAGDHIIVNLLQATDQRLAEIQGAFRDQWDFVARVRRFFPDASDFGTQSGQLFQELIAEVLDTPQKIEEALLQNDAVARAYSLLEEFQAHLIDDDVVRRVEPQSSDGLLMLFLERYADQVLERHPGGRGQGRPPRIASAARRFREMEHARPAGPPADPAATAPTASD